MGDRNAVFQRLKPPCVALSQATLALNGPRGDIQTITERLGELKHELSAGSKAPFSLDEKLADYVFFPLSHVLKASQKVSIRCLELTLQCLAILIDKGWRSRVQSQLAAQVIILCTMMACKHPKGLKSTDSTEELRASALWCLHHLFDVIGSAPETRDALTSEANFPQLGQTISTMLDAIVDSVSAEAQTAATHALRSLTSNVTRDLKASFLPGIVSKLTKVLTPHTKQRRTPVVLIGALEVLQLLFIETLSDTTSDIAPDVPDASSPARQSHVIDEEWLENAATQLKPAVTSILKLRSHSRYDVREALARFCFVLLRQCRKSLPNCNAQALETVLLLSSKQTGDAIRFRLESLAQGDSSISNLLQSTLFDWLQSVPTQMQGADDQAKIDRLQQVYSAYSVAVASGIDITAIDRSMANVLRDSVMIAIQLPKTGQRSAALALPVQSLDPILLETDSGKTKFSSTLVKHKSQQEVIIAIEGLTKLVTSSATSSSTFAANLARSLRQSHDVTQVAAFWLLLTATENVLIKDELDTFLDLEDEQFAVYKEHLEDIFAISLTILTGATEEPADPRLQSLALRTLALRARMVGEEFRVELIDALYPVLHTLATPDEDLQRDSIATLNIFTSSCGYDSVKSLIVDNVDYLTNAVALKLNAFDVSPQAPQVLLMMVRLAGPSLLPYLEDTVESIFAALKDYHGYPVLVELLFKVLGVVAEEGAKDSQLAIIEGKATEFLHTRRDQWRPSSMDDLGVLLADRRHEESQTQPQTQPEAHPREPWKDDSIEQQGSDNDALRDEDEPPIDIEVTPPAPKIYGLLLKISELTQHFLPSASASLRLSLLALIKTSTPAIARHENSFLPLINTLWPEVVSRLDDAEPSVVASALDIVALLCENAGDFMRSRVLQLWPSLVETYHRTSKDIQQGFGPATTQQIPMKGEGQRYSLSERSPLDRALNRMRTTPGDYSDTSTRLVWKALIQTIISSVRYVDLSPDHFDEALEMLDPVLEDQPETRGILEAENPDAVWLARIRTGVLTVPDFPAACFNANWRLAAVAD